MNEANHYLIKRSNSFRDIIKTNSKKKKYFEITISSKKILPPSVVLKENDIIYIAETSGGIYAKGIVVNSGPILEFDNIHDIIAFSKSMNDDSYWLDKISVFSQKSGKLPKLRFHEYSVRQTILPQTIPYNGPLQKFAQKGFSHIFFKLTLSEVNYLRNPDFNLKKIEHLKPEIPGELRLKVYSFLNKKYSIGHLIDIDHFVPKSIGGPGNILENLVPIGLSLNRYKSDSVPKSFYIEVYEGQYAHRFEKFRKNLLPVIDIEDEYIRRSDYPKLIELAREINYFISQWGSIEEAREFYFQVMNRSHPAYAQLLNAFE